MDLIQLIYVSRPFGYDEAALNGILVDARRCNLRDDITGALVCRQDVFLQMLEGPEKLVRATFGRIRKDDRHTEVKPLVHKPIRDRLFGDWAMLHDPARSLIWTRDDIAAGAIDRATPDEVSQVFTSLAGAVKAGG